MKKTVKALLIVMIAITIIYIVAVAYANTNSSWNDNLPSNAKHPTEYGIWLNFIAEPTEQPFPESYTPKELGITLVQSKSIEDRFHIYIIDKEKAIPWMRNREYNFFSIEYKDKFYDVSTLHVTPGLPEEIKRIQVPIGTGIVCGWGFTGVLSLYFKRRKGE